MTAKPTKQITIKLPESYNKILEEISQSRGITKTEVIRQAIGMEKFFNDEERKGNKVLIEDAQTKKFRQILRL